MKTDKHSTAQTNTPSSNKSPEVVSAAPAVAFSVRLMRVHEVSRVTGLGRSTIYDRMKINDFPKPLKLGSRWVAWHSRDIEDWMANLRN